MEEIIEVEIELGNGSKHKLSLKEVDSDEWNAIEKGTKGLLCLVNGQQMLIDINNAGYDGVSFKINGSKLSYFYEENVIDILFIVL